MRWCDNYIGELVKLGQQGSLAQRGLRLQNWCKYSLYKQKFTTATHTNLFSSLYRRCTSTSADLSLTMARTPSIFKSSASSSNRSTKSQTLKSIMRRRLLTGFATLFALDKPYPISSLSSSASTRTSSSICTIVLGLLWQAAKILIKASASPLWRFRRKILTKCSSRSTLVAQCQSWTQQ